LYLLARTLTGPLSTPRRGPKCKLGYHRVFNLILWVLYTGMQWKCLPVPRAGDGTALIHYTTIYKVFAKWVDDGLLEQAFIASVRHLAEHRQLDLNILHGDGTKTVAKKGGDGIGYSGHKHQRGEKIIAIVDNNGFVLAPLPVAPVNETDTVLLPEGLNTLKRVARLTVIWAATVAGSAVLPSNTSTATGKPSAAHSRPITSCGRSPRLSRLSPWLASGQQRPSR
jgi:transposase